MKKLLTIALFLLSVKGFSQCLPLAQSMDSATFITVCQPNNITGGLGRTFGMDKDSLLNWIIRNGGGGSSNKVDSTTVRNDSTFYWINGSNYWGGSLVAGSFQDLMINSGNGTLLGGQGSLYNGVLTLPNGSGQALNIGGTSPNAALYVNIPFHNSGHYGLYLWQSEYGFSPFSVSPKGTTVIDSREDYGGHPSALTVNAEGGGSSSNAALTVTQNMSSGNKALNVQGGTVTLEDVPPGNSTYNFMQVDPSGNVLQVPSDSIPSSAWGLNGNAGTDPSANFIGTIDTESVIFKCNNVFAGMINPADVDFIPSTSFGAKSNSQIPTSAANQGNCAFGVRALQADFGQLNCAFGEECMSASTVGNTNSGFGAKTLQFIYTASNNNAFGAFSLENVLDGGENNAIGVESQIRTIHGSHNVSIGDGGFANWADGSRNTSLGECLGNAGMNGGIVWGNTAAGLGALGEGNYTQLYNVALGFNAGFYGSWKHMLFIDADSLGRADSTSVLTQSLIVGQFVEGTSAGQWLEINGNLSIGGQSDNVAAVTVTTGDIYINQIGSGVIMKSPDGTCWRVTPSNITGALVSTSITCP